MDIYASHHSYIGDYKNIGLNSDNKLVSMGNAGNCYDMYSDAGINRQEDFNKEKLSFDYEANRAVTILMMQAFVQSRIMMPIPISITMWTLGIMVQIRVLAMALLRGTAR